MALSSLPLATANAIFYAAPLLVMVLSVVFFRERLTGLSLLAVISGLTSSGQSYLRLPPGRTNLILSRQGTPTPHTRWTQRPHSSDSTNSGTDL